MYFLCLLFLIFLFFSFSFFSCTPFSYVFPSLCSIFSFRYPSTTAHISIPPSPSTFPHILFLLISWFPCFVKFPDFHSFLIPLPHNQVLFQLPNFHHCKFILTSPRVLLPVRSSVLKIRVFCSSTFPCPLLIFTPRQDRQCFTTLSSI